jgi:4'-phosphopantetheinyl transferase
MSSVLRRIGEDGVEILVERLDFSIENVRMQSVALSADEQARAARYRHERDRARFIVARARLRALLGEKTGLSASSLCFDYGDSGKPFLSGSDLQFSLSHCDDLAAYAFARQGPVGIDLEIETPLAEADAIASEYFSPEERKLYRKLGFFVCWTRREALAKASGIGLGTRLGESGRGWKLESFSPLPGVIGAVATQAVASPRGRCN